LGAKQKDKHVSLQPDFLNARTGENFLPIKDKAFDKDAVI